MYSFYEAISSVLGSNWSHHRVKDRIRWTLMCLFMGLWLWVWMEVKIKTEAKNIKTKNETKTNLISASAQSWVQHRMDKRWRTYTYSLCCAPLVSYLYNETRYCTQDPVNFQLNGWIHTVMLVPSKTSLTIPNSKKALITHGVTKLKVTFLLKHFSIDPRFMLFSTKRDLWTQSAVDKT